MLKLIIANLILSYTTGRIGIILPTFLEKKLNEDIFGFSLDEHRYIVRGQKGKKGILLSFVQRGFPIGQVNVVDSISVSQVRRLLKEAMQIPIESDGAIDFAGRIIHAAIRNLTESAEATKSTEIQRQYKAYCLQY